MIAFDIELQNCVGCGGFADVYRAIWKRPEGNRVVAVKEFRPDHGPWKWAPFFYELGSWVTLGWDCPYIARLYGISSTPMPRLFLEWIDGGSLQDKIANGSDSGAWCVGRSMSLGEFHELAVQLFTAVKHTHDCGLAHCDIKPANVLMSRGQSGDRHRYLLADFGAARCARHSCLPHHRVEASTEMYYPRFQRLREAGGDGLGAWKSMDIRAAALTLLVALTALDERQLVAIASGAPNHRRQLVESVTRGRPVTAEFVDALFRQLIVKRSKRLRADTALQMASEAHEAASGVPWSPHVGGSALDRDWAVAIESYVGAASALQECLEAAMALRDWESKEAWARIMRDRLESLDRLLCGKMYWARNVDCSGILRTLLPLLHGWWREFGERSCGNSDLETTTRDKQLTDWGYAIRAVCSAIGGGASVRIDHEAKLRQLAFAEGRRRELWEEKGDTLFATTILLRAIACQNHELAPVARRGWDAALGMAAASGAKIDALTPVANAEIWKAMDDTDSNHRRETTVAVRRLLGELRDRRGYGSARRGAIEQ